LFEEERPRPRGPRRDREPPDLEATELLVPTGVSVPALIAPYLGLIGFCLPIVGLPFALLAVIMGTIGLLKRRRGPTYGSVTGIIRAVIGLVLGALGLLISTVLILFLISENMRRK
jgi:hypothetical protein